MSRKNKVTLHAFHQYTFRTSIALLLLAGCQDEEIREYVVPVENERIFTSDLLKDQFGAIPFEWKAPAEWVVTDNDQFSKIAWKVGPKEDEARITLSDLPIAAGLVPQVTRWRGQIELKTGPNDDPMSDTETLKLTGGNATYAHLKGPESTILGLLVPQGDKLWIFKFRGNNNVAEQQRTVFREFCESIKIP
jgi:hypothetical protein